MEGKILKKRDREKERKTKYEGREIDKWNAS